MTVELAVVAGIVAAAAAYLWRAWFVRKRACARCALLKNAPRDPGKS